MAKSSPKFSPMKTAQETGLARNLEAAEMVAQALRSEGYTVGALALVVGWWRADTNARPGTVGRVQRALGLE